MLTVVAVSLSVLALAMTVLCALLCRLVLRKTDVARVTRRLRRLEAEQIEVGLKDAERAARGYISEPPPP